MVSLLKRTIPDLITKSTAPGHREAVQIAGNACKCLIAMVRFLIIKINVVIFLFFFLSSYSSDFSLTCSLSSFGCCFLLLFVVCCLLFQVKDPTTKEVSDLAIRGGAIQTIIDVIRSTNDPSTRKNSAIVLARMAKSPELMVVIREKRGMEILMSLGRQIVD